MDQDKISLLDKLNADMKNISLTVDNLISASIMDSVAIQSLKNIAEMYVKDREGIIKYCETNNRVSEEHKERINHLDSRVEALELSLVKLSAMGAQTRQERPGVVELLQTQMKKLFKVRFHARY
jgi:hypothetical protein